MSNYCVYIIKSLPYPDQIYIGYTQDIKTRIISHNSGSTPHTSKYKPWELIVSLIFTNGDCAIEFERYLKSGSGRAFALKRFLKNPVSKEQHP